MKITGPCIVEQPGATEVTSDGKSLTFRFTRKSLFVPPGCVLDTDTWEMDTSKFRGGTIVNCD